MSRPPSPAQRYCRFTVTATTVAQELHQCRKALCAGLLVVNSTASIIDRPSPPTSAASAAAT